MNQVRILVVGATGFIGSRILQALTARTDTLVSILTRQPQRISSTPKMTVLRGDLSDAESLLRATRKMDVVINAASYVGSDPELAHQVNLNGTRSLVHACNDSNVGRFIQLSTAAIYGTGPHRGAQPWELSHSPQSVASQSRAAADQEALTAGGITVRPNLVYGAGDRWCVPGTIRMIQELGATIEDGSPLLSVIDVDYLGTLIADLALTVHPVVGTFHAANPEPVSLAQFLNEIDLHVLPLRIDGSASVFFAEHQLHAKFRPHQVHMLGMDHYYNSSALWNLSDTKPAPFHFTEEARRWYRKYCSQ